MLVDSSDGLNLWEQYTFEIYLDKCALIHKVHSEKI